MAETETRPVRMCDSCGGVDDHPRHVVSHAAGAAATSDETAAKALQAAGADHYAEILRQVRDDSVVMKHMDCCREDGCPDRTCDQITAGAEDKRGKDLLKHIQTNHPKGLLTLPLAPKPGDQQSRPVQPPAPGV